MNNINQNHTFRALNSSG